MKKYLILAATAALVLGACAKVETIAPKAEPQVIGFSNYAPKALNKAAAANYVDSNVLVNGAQFAVWSWKTANGTAFTGSNGAKFFSDWYTVTYQNGGDADGNKNLYPQGLRYWPNGENPDWLSFAAYYPKEGAGITASTESGLGAYSFTAQNEAANQVDFMVADVVANKTYDNCTPTKGTVALTFKHQLTKVQVKFKTTPAVAKDAGITVKITDAKFVNINNAGTLTSSYSAGATSTAWSAQSGAAEYAIAFPAEKLDSVAKSKAGKTVADEDIFLMVPQTMLANTDDKAQYIEVKWTVEITGQETINGTKKLYLDDCYSTDGGDTLANIDWNKNNFVTYVITVGPQPILFTATAEEWDDPERIGYYNVQ